MPAASAQAEELWIGEPKHCGCGLGYACIDHRIEKDGNGVMDAKDAEVALIAALTAGDQEAIERAEASRTQECFSIELRDAYKRNLRFDGWPTCNGGRG